MSTCVMLPSIHQIDVSLCEESSFEDFRPRTKSAGSDGMSTAWSQCVRPRTSSPRSTGTTAKQDLGETTILSTRITALPSQDDRVLSVPNLSATTFVRQEDRVRSTPDLGATTILRKNYGRFIGRRRSYKRRYNSGRRVDLCPLSPSASNKTQTPSKPSELETYGRLKPFLQPLSGRANHPIMYPLAELDPDSFREYSQALCQA